GGLAPGDASTDRVLALDPATGAARLVGRLAVPVHDAGGAWLAGRAVVMGGGSPATVATAQSWAGGTGRPLSRLPRPRSDCSVATVGGTAYVVGGYDGSRLDRSIL